MRGRCQARALPGEGARYRALLDGGRREVEAAGLALAGVAAGEAELAVWTSRTVTSTPTGGGAWRATGRAGSVATGSAGP